MKRWGLHIIVAALAIASAPAQAKDYPDKPAGIVLRDAKIICPMLYKWVQTGARDGKEAARDIVRFAEGRKYSRSDTHTLLLYCQRYSQTGGF